MSEFKDFKLDPSIQEVINKKGYLTPTPIQEKSIPLLTTILPIGIIGLFLYSRTARK